MHKKVDPSTLDSSLPKGTRFVDMTGIHIGRVLVISYAGKRNCIVYWNCRCDCGTEFITLGSSLRTGNTSSCGCYKTEFHSSHGKCDIPEYGAWAQIKARCIGDACPMRYKDRGIKICDRWRDSFENFFEDMGERPSPSHSIDRINNDGDYEPGNCRWATKKEQGRNRSNTTIVDYMDERRSLMDWCDILELSFPAMRYRILQRGWSAKKAFETPVNSNLSRRGPRDK